MGYEVGDDPSRGKPQSLGELIVALGPGAQCPLCGGRLQRREAGDAALLCPKCGCEVAAAGGDTELPCRMFLGAAA